MLLLVLVFLNAAWEAVSIPVISEIISPFSGWNFGKGVYFGETDFKLDKPHQNDPSSPLESDPPSPG